MKNENLQENFNSLKTVYFECKANGLVIDEDKDKLLFTTFTNTDEPILEEYLNVRDIMELYSDDIFKYYFNNVDYEPGKGEEEHTRASILKYNGDVTYIIDYLIDYLL